MFLSRIQTNTCIRNQALKRATCLVLPRQTPLAKITLQTNHASKIRTFKTLSARLAEESSTKVPNPVSKVNKLCKIMRI